MSIKPRNLYIFYATFLFSCIYTVTSADTQGRMMQTGGTYDVGYATVASGTCDDSINHGPNWVRFIGNYELITINELAKSNFNPDFRKKLVNDRVDSYMKSKWVSWLPSGYQGIYSMISNRIKEYVLASDPDLTAARAVWNQNNGNIADFDPNNPSTILRVGYLSNMTRNYIVIFAPVNNPAFTLENRQRGMPPFLTDIGTPLLKVSLPAGLNPSSPANAWGASAVTLAWSQSPTTVPPNSVQRDIAKYPNKSFYYYQILEIPTGSPEGYVLAAAVNFGNHKVLAEWNYPGVVKKLTIEAQ